MILLVFGTHFDTQDGLEGLGRSTDYYVLSEYWLEKAGGLYEEALERVKAGRVPVIVPPNRVDRRKRIWRVINDTVRQARELGIDLVIETMYSEPFKHCAHLADYLCINKTLFKTIGARRDKP